MRRVRLHPQGQKQRPFGQAMRPGMDKVQRGFPFNAVGESKSPPEGRACKRYFKVGPIIMTI